MTQTSEAMADVRQYLEMKHTTGPWTFGHLGLHRLWVGKSHNHLPVATIAWDCDDAHDNARENARLIAEAPELIEIVRAISNAWDGPSMEPADFMTFVAGYARRMRVSVAKIEGRS